MGDSGHQQRRGSGSAACMVETPCAAPSECRSTEVVFKLPSYRLWHFRPKLSSWKYQEMAGAARKQHAEIPQPQPLHLRTEPLEESSGLICLQVQPYMGCPMLPNVAQYCPHAPPLPGELLSDSVLHISQKICFNANAHPTPCAVRGLVQH